MKKIMFIALTLALLCVSLSISAIADDQSQIQVCVAGGFPADICATCANPSATDGTDGSSAACTCKLVLSQLPGEFENMGQCIQAAHAIGIY